MNMPNLDLPALTAPHADNIDPAVDARNATAARPAVVPVSRGDKLYLAAHFTDPDATCYARGLAFDRSDRIVFAALRARFDRPMNLDDAARHARFARARLRYNMPAIAFADPLDPLVGRPYADVVSPAQAFAVHRALHDATARAAWASRDPGRGAAAPSPSPRLFPLPYLAFRAADLDATLDAVVGDGGGGGHGGSGGSGRLGGSGGDARWIPAALAAGFAQTLRAGGVVARALGPEEYVGPARMNADGRAVGADHRLRSLIDGRERVVRLPAGALVLARPRQLLKDAAPWAHLVSRPELAGGNTGVTANGVSGASGPRDGRGLLNWAGIVALCGGPARCRAVLREWLCGQAVVLGEHPGEVLLPAPLVAHAARERRNFRPCGLWWRTDRTMGAYSYGTATAVFAPVAARDRLAVHEVVDVVLGGRTGRPAASPSAAASGVAPARVVAANVIAA
jgi:hypothetical protein